MHMKGVQSNVVEGSQHLHLVSTNLIGYSLEASRWAMCAQSF
jgi:hypothetical protein